MSCRYDFIAAPPNVTKERAGDHAVKRESTVEEEGEKR